MTLFNAILEILKEKNWQHVFDPSKNRVQLDVVGKNASWRMNMIVLPENYIALFYSYYPLLCDEDMIDKMGIFLHEINLGLVSGNFEFDVKERKIRFKTHVDFSRSEIIFSQIEQAIIENIKISDKYFLAISQFFATDESSDEILARIEEDNNTINP